MEEGNRTFISTDDSINVPYISLRNKLRWILYLIVKLDIKNLDINIDFAIWGDGADSSGNIFGLYSSIKVVDVGFKNGRTTSRLQL